MGGAFGMAHHRCAWKLSGQVANGAGMVHVDVSQADVIQAIHTQSGNCVDEWVRRRRRTHVHQIDRFRPNHQPGADEVLEPGDGGG